MIVLWSYKDRISYHYKPVPMIKAVLLVSALVIPLSISAQELRMRTESDELGLQVSGNVERVMNQPKVDLSIPRVYRVGWDVSVTDDDILVQNMAWFKQQSHDPCRELGLKLSEAVACQMTQKSDSQFAGRIEDIKALQRRQEFFSNLAQRFSFGIASVRAAKIAPPSESDIWGNIVRDTWKVEWFWVQASLQGDPNKRPILRSFWLKKEWLF